MPFNLDKITKMYHNGATISKGMHLDKLMSFSQIIQYLMSKQTTTRAGLAINPLEGYSVTSLNTVANNVMPSHGDYRYVGGTEETFTYDFGLKVAGSVAECPMKIYSYNSATIQPATSLTWNEITNQSIIDNVKNQEGTPWTYATATSGNTAQMMIELDLTPLVNSLSGGSNSDFKTNKIKSITADVYAMGSGANAGVATNGVNIQLWNNYISAGSWTKDGVNLGSTSSTASTISKLSVVPQAYTDGKYYLERLVNANNKIYVLVASQYASDGTIASSVSLDYIKITVVTNRVADVIAPQTINLPSKWSMLVKGFAPNWDSTQTLQNYLVFEIVKDTNNRFEFYKSTTNRKWIFRKTVDTVGTSASADFLTDYNKYQIQNMLAVQSDSNIIIYILLNNGTVIKASTPQATAITGQSTLYFIGINGGTLPQANALAESFHFLPDYVPTDAEATDILKLVDGNKAGVVNKPIVDKVLPNNKYSLTGTADLYYNTIKTRTVSADFTTNTYENRIVLGSGAVCKLKM